MAWAERWLGQALAPREDGTGAPPENWPSTFSAGAPDLSRVREGVKPLPAGASLAAIERPWWMAVPMQPTPQGPCHLSKSGRWRAPVRQWIPGAGNGRWQAGLVV